MRRPPGRRGGGVTAGVQETVGACDTAQLASEDGPGFFDWLRSHNDYPAPPSRSACNTSASHRGTSMGVHASR
jgi:hypothetical protein